MLDIAFAKAALPKSGALALLVAEGVTPSGLWSRADEATDGAVSRAAAVAQFKGGKNQSCVVLAPGGGLSRVVLVGLGPEDALTQLVIEQAGGTAAQRARPRCDCGAGRPEPFHDAAGAGRVRRDAARLPLRPLSHDGKGRGQAGADEADAARRGGAETARCLRAAEGGGGRHLPLPRPDQRAAERAQSRDHGRALPRADHARPHGRHPGAEGARAAWLRRAARRVAGQRERAARRGDALERRRRGRAEEKPAGRLHRQGRHLRQRRHQHQAGRRHGGHEVGHGRRRCGGRG